MMGDMKYKKEEAKNHKEEMLALITTKLKEIKFIR